MDTAACSTINMNLKIATHLLCLCCQNCVLQSHQEKHSTLPTIAPCFSGAGALRPQNSGVKGTFERYKAVLSLGCVLCLAAPKVWSCCLTHSSLLGHNDCLRLSTAGGCSMYSVVSSVRVGNAHCAVQQLLLWVSQVACAAP